MTLRIYGQMQSRAYRCLWMARETGVPFEHIPTDFKTGNKAPEYLQINPNGRVPALQDGDLTLFESMAINLYLAKTYGRAKGLYPDSPAAEAQIIQWSFWVMTEIEKPLLLLLLDAAGMVPATPEAQDKARQDLQRPLRVLEQHLQARDYIMGADFTAADVNVASVMAWARPAKLDLAAYPRVAAWLKTCLARPAAARV